MQKSYQISLHGVSEKDSMLFECMLILLEKRTRAEWSLSTDHNLSDIAVVDMDQDGHQQLWEEVNQHGRGVPVAFYEDYTTLPHQYALKKPVRSLDLVKLMTQIIQTKGQINIRQQVAGQAGGSSTGHVAAPANKAPVQPQRKTANVKVQVRRPEIKRLYDLLLNNDINEAIEIQYREVELIIDIPRQQFFTEHKLLMLSMLFKLSTDKLNISSYPDAKLKYLEQHASSQPLDFLIWSSILLGANGELFAPINSDTKLKLKKWPNFRSMVHLPLHNKITAFMMKQEATINEICSQLNMQADIVINFINACLVLGYLNIDYDRHDSTGNSFQLNSKNRSLFSKIRKRFGLGG